MIVWKAVWNFFFSFGGYFLLTFFLAARNICQCWLIFEVMLQGNYFEILGYFTHFGQLGMVFRQQKYILRRKYILFLLQI